jgi:hypothetical protein
MNVQDQLKTIEVSALISCIASICCISIVDKCRVSSDPIFSRFCYISYICLTFPKLQPEILYFSKTMRKKEQTTIKMDMYHK